MADGKERQVPRNEARWAGLLRKFQLELDTAIEFWRHHGKWDQQDVDVLRGLVEERLRLPDDPNGDGGDPALQVRNLFPKPSTHGDVIESAYVPVEAQTLASVLGDLRYDDPTEERVEAAANLIAAGVLDGNISVPYVAFRGQRVNSFSNDGKHMFVNLVIAAPGFIEITDDDGRRRIETSAAKATSQRTSPRGEAQVCPECFLTLPATGVCEECEG